MIEGLRLNQAETYIRFNYTGKFSEEMGKKCIDAMVEACRQIQVSQTLLDCRNMTGEIQIFDGFKVAVYGVKMRGSIETPFLVSIPNQFGGVVCQEKTNRPAARP